MLVHQRVDGFSMIWSTDFHGFSNLPSCPIVFPSLSVGQVTCIGTSAEQATAAWDMYAFDGNVLSNSVLVGLGSVSQSNIRYVSLAGVQGYIYIITSHVQVISTRKISHVCIHFYVQQMIFPLKKAVSIARLDYRTALGAEAIHILAKFWICRRQWLEKSDTTVASQVCIIIILYVIIYLYILCVYIIVYTCIYIECTIFAKWYMLHEAKANILRRSRARYISEMYGCAQGIQNGNTTCCRMGYGYFTMDSKSWFHQLHICDFKWFLSMDLNPAAYRRGLWARGQLHS